MFNNQNLVKYMIMLFIVAGSTFYIPSCSIINEHALYIGLLASSTFVLLDRFMPHIVIIENKNNSNNILNE